MRSNPFTSVAMILAITQRDQLVNGFLETKIRDALQQTHKRYDTSGDWSALFELKSWRDALSKSNFGHIYDEEFKRYEQTKRELGV